MPPSTGSNSKPLSHLHDHLLVHAHPPHDAAKLLEADPAVLVLVGVQHRPVHDLRQLLVLQVLAYHHLQHFVQLVVRYETVAINVIDSKGEPETKVFRRNYK